VARKESSQAADLLRFSLLRRQASTHMTILALPEASLHYVEIIITNNNNNYDNVYGAITMIKVIDESSSGSSDECRLSAGWPPTPRPSQSTSAVSPPKIGSYHPHPPSPLLLLLSP